MADLGPTRGCRPDRARSGDPPNLGILQETLPGGRLGGGWNTASKHSASLARTPLPITAHPTAAPARLSSLQRPHPITPSSSPQRHPYAPTPSFLRPPPSFLRRQEPPFPPNPATLTPEQECRTMPPPSNNTPGNPNLANPHQNLTPSTPAPTPIPSKTATAPTTPSTSPNTPRTTLNKSEQT